jgi:mannose-6-phosphate isomerase-like protein (cupin superfamily)
MKIVLQDLVQKLPLPATEKWPEGVWDVEGLKNGSMSLILYTPKGKDYQTAHDQDELYIAVRGSGVLIKDKEHYPFDTGDALFVPAGVDHHFENFTDDLTVWAVFWGPKGGEK